MFGIGGVANGRIEQALPFQGGPAHHGGGSRAKEELRSSSSSSSS
jgi:hypothetical protein